MGSLDGQLDQKLMHTPRAHCEMLAILLVDPGVLLFDRSTMKDMAPLSGYQPEQDLAKEEYKYPKVLHMSHRYGKIISCFTSNID